MQPFYIGKHKIDRPVLLAPMAGVSEMPFRILAQELGAGLCTTELISAKGIFYKNRRTRQYMTFDRDKEHPYSLQLFGGDVTSMAEAAKEAQLHGADIIDINMGCPVKKVTKTGSGTALMTDIPRAQELVRRMCEAVQGDVPITVKMRTGWDKDHINCVEVGQALEEAGASAFALHGRTRAQGYEGEADWQIIAALKRAVSVPVIGNGDVRDYADAQRMADETGCDGVMIGRAALGNPWVFESCAAGRALPGPTPERRCATIVQHFKDHLAFHQNLDGGSAGRKTSPEAQAVRTFRQHLIWYSRGYEGGAAFRKEAVQAKSAADVLRIIESFFARLSDEHSGELGDDGIDYRQAFG